MFDLGGGFGLRIPNTYPCALHSVALTWSKMSVLTLAINGSFLSLYFSILRVGIQLQ